MSRFDGKKVKAVFGGKGFYIALALCLLAAGIVGYYTLLRPQAPAEPASNPASNVPDDRDNAWVAPAVQPEENVPAAPPAEETPISDPPGPAAPGHVPAGRHHGNGVQRHGADV